MLKLIFSITSVLMLSAGFAQSGAVNAEKAAFEAARSAGYDALFGAFKNNEPVDLLKATLGQSAADDIPMSALAQMLFMRRHYAKAAFLYSVDAQINPDNFESYANLAAILVELNAGDPKLYPIETLDWALASARVAAKNLPDNALAQNTLSRAALARYQVKAADASPAGLLPEALLAAQKATALDPLEPLLWSNLARIYQLMGQGENVAQAMERARSADPNSPGYWIAATDFGLNPEPSPTTQSSIPAKPQQCSVNFNCQVQCSSGLLTGSLIVSCELEQSTQQASCEAGKPFASAYDCKAEKLLFGVAKQKPEFSFCTQNVCLRFKTNGKGGVDFETDIKTALGPVDGFLKIEGTASPERGYNIVRLSPSIKYNLLRKLPIASQLKKWGVSSSYYSGSGKISIGGKDYRPALIGI